MYLSMQHRHHLKVVFMILRFKLYCDLINDLQLGQACVMAAFDVFYLKTQTLDKNMEPVEK